MRRLYLTWVLALWCLSGLAQNINRLEYFIDTDPGFGNATSVSITSGTTVTKSFNVSLSAVSDGFHTLYVRARDINGNWSFVVSRPFYKIAASSIAAAPDINRIEYFVDTDPGPGLQNSVTFTPGENVEKAFTVDLTSLSDGFHTLYFRARDANGNWSLVVSRPFYKIPASAISSLPKISKLEYFVDSDPGHGSATSVTVTAATSVNKTFNIALSAQSDGFHTLYIRAADENGRWSHVVSRPFYKVPASAVAALPNITRLEYFVGADPGLGNGTEIPITAATSVEKSITIDLAGYSLGDYKLQVRARDANNKWSLVYTTVFSVVPQPTLTSFSPTKGAFGRQITITGTNFSTTAASNTVLFNGVQASVVSSTATSIVATVPNGATDGKISVTVKGQTATSAANFDVVAVPTITSYPTLAAVGEEIEITGTNFSATKADNVVKIGTATATIVTASATTLVVTVPTLAAGYYLPTVTVHGESVSGSNYINVTTSPILSSFSPTKAAEGATVTINGNNFGAGAAVSFNGTSAATTFVSATKLTAVVPVNATTGTISVTYDGKSATSASTFTVAPVITGFSPNEGEAATTVTINGRNFSTAANGNIVKFGDQIATVTPVSTTQLTATVPAGVSGVVSISITVAAQTHTATSTFKVLQAPIVTSFTPTKGKVGDEITINGSNFESGVTVSFNGVPATSVTVVSAIKLVVVVPTNATTGKISVTFDGKTGSSASNFTVAPVISGFTPNEGGHLTEVTINGMNFSTTANGNIVKFGDKVATVTPSSNTQLTAVVPDGLSGNVSVSVTVAAQTTTAASTFKIVPPPTIAAFSPVSGYEGDVITITGTDFLSNIANVAVSFNGLAGEVTQLNSTANPQNIKVKVPLNATTGQITVTIAGQSAISSTSFVVAPTITSITPSSGAAGNVIQISGRNFDTGGLTTVAFNGVAGTISTISESEITVAIPNGATTGNITVLANTQSAESEKEFVIKPLQITSFSNPVVYGGQSVTLRGTGFSAIAANNEVKVNGQLAAVTNASAGELVINVPEDATTGFVTVKIQDVLGTSTEELKVTKLKIAGYTMPDYYTVGDPSLPVGLTVNSRPELQKVVLHYKGITQSEFKEVELILPASSGTVTYNIPKSEITDPLGVTLYAVVTDIGGFELTGQQFSIFLRYPAGSASTDLPGLQFGRTVSAYNIVAIPLMLEDKKSSSVFRDLGEKDKREWRLFSYSGQSYTENPGTIDPGVGYWLIVKDSKEINPGPGTTVPASAELPFTISLKKGWNLIGNPYNFSISWDDVKAANPGADFGDLRLFRNGELSDETILPRFRGAFVSSDQAIELKIPPISHGSNGREEGKSDPTDLTADRWNLPISISDGDFTSSIYGIGMHPRALEDKDRWDEYDLPLLSGLSSFVFKTRVLSEGILSKDVVPTDAVYSWETTLANEKPVKLYWSPSIVSSNDVGLTLEISSQIELVDMMTTTGVTIPPGEHTIMIHFGDAQYREDRTRMKEFLVGSLFPNPVRRGSETLSMFLNIPSEGLGHFEVFDVMGKKMFESEKKVLPPGRYASSWNIDFAGFSPGLYTIRAQIAGRIRSYKVVVE
jgi:hypothetical protein